jgi:prefoldin alpha subunit
MYKNHLTHVIKFHCDFQELTIFQDSLQTLKMAKTKFGASKEALEQFKEGWEEKKTLIPLTGSMYVPGKIKDINNVIVDIGTGYYVEQDRDSAKDYFKRKVDFVGEQMEKIEILGFEKSQIRDAICEVMALKIQQLKGGMPTA